MGSYVRRGILLFLLLAGATVWGPTSAYAGVDDYPDPWRPPTPMDSMFDSWGEYNRECTSFVAWRLHSRNGYEMRFHDDAKRWGPDAAARGYAVDMNPAVGSVAWKGSGAGHVAWVEQVGDSTVTIEDYNSDFTGHYGEHVVATSSFSGYIHFHDMPASLTDGSFVRASDTGNVYRIAGGAPLYVNSWDPFGGPKPTIPMTQAQINALPQYPADGSFISDLSDGRVYKVAGGSPEYVSAADAASVPGYGTQPITGETLYYRVVKNRIPH